MFVEGRTIRLYQHIVVCEGDASKWSKTFQKLLLNDIKRHNETSLGLFQFTNFNEVCRGLGYQRDILTIKM